MVTLETWNTTGRDAADKLFEALASRHARGDVTAFNAHGGTPDRLAVGRRRATTDVERRLAHGLFRYPLGEEPTARRPRW